MLTALDLTIGTMPLEVIVWGLFFGIMIGGALAVYNKRYLGEFVRRLIQEEAFSPESALTLSEIGFGKNAFVQNAIKKGVAFKSIVYEKDDEVVVVDGIAKPVFHEEIDFSQARFYIPYEFRHRAELKFDKKGTHLMLVVIASLFFLALALLILHFSEPFVQLVNDMLKG